MTPGIILSAGFLLALAVGLIRAILYRHGNWLEAAFEGFMISLITITGTALTVLATYTLYQAF